MGWSGCEEEKEEKKETKGCIGELCRGSIIAGWTASKGAGSSDVWVMRLDSDGNILWDKTFGGTGGDAAFSIQETAD